MQADAYCDWVAIIIGASSGIGMALALQSAAATQPCYLYGVDYIECAVCKFLRAEHAFELAPYACAFNRPVSELMGWGLTRMKTITAGYPRCEFRFKQGGETNVPIPPSLQRLIENEP